jgi:regulator of protease activity HflC (stomatin/prohibitin superfamily)
MGFEKLIELLVQWIEALKFCCIVEYYEEGVHLRKGNFLRVVSPGLRFHLPGGLDRIICYNVKPCARPLGLQSLLTKDGRAVSINTVITHYISDIKTAVLEVENVAQAILDSCMGEIGRLVMTSTWDQIVHEDFPNKLSIACRRRAKKYGIHIEEVQIMELTPARALRLLQDTKAGAG